MVLEAQAGGSALPLHPERDRDAGVGAHFLVKNAEDGVALAFLQAQHRRPVSPGLAGIGFYALPDAR